MKKQIGICALIAVLVLVAVSCASFTAETKYITNTAFITAVEEETDINWTKAEDGTVPLTRENLEAIRAVTELDLSYMELTDLSGIEWFTGLEVLNCSDNRLTELDLSHNPTLEELYCYGNQLRSLDLSQNTALIRLYCYNNQLTELDVSYNPQLKYLQCYKNQLKELELSQNTVLKWLDCSENRLTELDLSHNTALTTLSCGGNQLRLLNLSQNTALC